MNTKIKVISIVVAICCMVCQVGSTGYSLAPKSMLVKPETQGPSWAEIRKQIDGTLELIETYPIDWQQLSDRLSDPVIEEELKAGWIGVFSPEMVDEVWKFFSQDFTGVAASLRKKAKDMQTRFALVGKDSQLRGDEYALKSFCLFEDFYGQTALFYLDLGCAVLFGKINPSSQLKELGGVLERELQSLYAYGAALREHSSHGTIDETEAMPAIQERINEIGRLENMLHAILTSQQTDAEILMRQVHKLMFLTVRSYFSTFEKRYNRLLTAYAQVYKVLNLGQVTPELKKLVAKLNCVVDAKGLTDLEQIQTSATDMLSGLLRKQDEIHALISNTQQQATEIHALLNEPKKVTEQLKEKTGLLQEKLKLTNAILTNNKLLLLAKQQRLPRGTTTMNKLMDIERIRFAIEKLDQLSGVSLSLGLFANRWISEGRLSLGYILQMLGICIVLDLMEGSFRALGVSSAYFVAFLVVVCFYAIYCYWYVSKWLIQGKLEKVRKKQELQPIWQDLEEAKSFTLAKISFTRALKKEISILQRLVSRAEKAIIDINEEIATCREEITSIEQQSQAGRQFLKQATAQIVSLKQALSHCQTVIDLAENSLRLITQELDSGRRQNGLLENSKVLLGALKTALKQVGTPQENNAISALREVTDKVNASDQLIKQELDGCMASQNIGLAA